MLTDTESAFGNCETTDNEKHITPVSFTKRLINESPTSTV